MALNVTPTPSAGKAKTSPASPASSSGVRPFSSSSSLSSLFSTIPGTPIPGTSMVTLAPPAAKTIAVVHGLDGCGKTEFVTRFCPGPVGLINCDRRGEETAYKSMTTYGKIVHYLDAALPADILNYSPEEAKIAAQEVLDRTIHDYLWMVNEAAQGRLGTIGIDTGTELTRAITYAVTGHPVKQKPTKGDPGDFGASDRAIKEYLWFFVNKARECRKVNLIILSRSKEEYSGPKPLGTYTWDCHKVFHQAADWSAYLSLTSVEEKVARFVSMSGDGKVSTSQLLKVQREGPSFEMTVTKGGQAIEEMGKVYTEAEWGEDGPFAYACSRLIPRTTVEDWK